MAESAIEGAKEEDREGIRPDNGKVRIPVIYDDCKITEDEEGIKHASSIHGVLSVLPDGETRVFMRNAIKFSIGNSDAERRIRVLVGELDGVRVYVMGDRVILTRRDLYF